MCCYTCSNLFSHSNSPFWPGNDCGSPTLLSKCRTENRGSRNSVKAWYADMPCAQDALIGDHKEMQCLLLSKGGKLYRKGIGLVEFSGTPEPAR